MKKLVIAVVLCFSAQVYAANGSIGKAAADDAKMAKPAGEAGKSGMQMPAARKPTNEKELKKELDAFYKSMDETMQKSDVSAMAALVDFPVLMITDDAKGQGSADNWNRETFTQVMGDSMKNMPPEAAKSTKVERKYDFLTDSLAVVHQTRTMTMGGKKDTMRSAEMVMKKNGKWTIKTMMEGGWGDMMPHGSGGQMGGTTGGQMGGTTGGAAGTTGGAAGTTGGSMGGGAGNKGGASGTTPGAGAGNKGGGTK